MTHSILKIERGVPSVVGDTATAEAPLESVSLLTGGANPFALEDWTPGRAALKRGGIFVDSQVSDGAALMAAASDNVTERIDVNITGETLQLIFANIAQLQRLAYLAVDFHTDFPQTEPVYLAHQYIDEPGPRYALIYTMDVDVEDLREDVNDPLQFGVQLTIVREPYWRPFPPGSNPKLWTAYAKGQTFTPSQMNLITGTTDTNLAYGAIANRKEWNTTQTAFQSQNWIDIDALNIPGDAPALCCVTTTFSSQNGGTLGFNQTGRIMAGRRVGRTSLPGRGSYTQLAHTILNAADATVGTDTSIANDTGGVIGDSSASTAKRSNTTFATATMAGRLVWSTAEEQLDINNLRGLYMAFLRARLSAAGVVNAQLVFKTSTRDAYLTTSPVPITPGITGTGDSGFWGSHYMGAVYIGRNNAEVGLEGLGLEVTSVATSDTNLRIELQAERTSGTPVLYVCDLVLVPFDEVACVAVGHVDVPTVGVDSNIVIDNTGYLAHGKDQGVTGDFDASSPYNLRAFGEFSGEFITLVPGIDNRLYFYCDADYNSMNISRPGASITARVNIMPRWIGARDA